jgi:hypothetical protein
VISVLCPTRGRPEHAHESVRSLLDTADGEIEVLLRVDDNDPDLERYRQRFAKFSARDNVWIACGPRVGYPGFHHMVNALAAVAAGTHLLLWNDDARMVTQGWDMLIGARNPFIPAVVTPGGVDHPFPTVTRAFYDALGHFSGGPHCDHWVCEAAKTVGCMASADIEITHLRDSLDDETKRESVWAQKHVTLPELSTPELQYRRQCDIDAVNQALAKVPA